MSSTFSAVVALHLYSGNELLLRITLSWSSNDGHLKHLFTWMWTCCLPVVVLYVNVILCSLLSLFAPFPHFQYVLLLQPFFLFDLFSENIYRFACSDSQNVTSSSFFHLWQIILFFFLNLWFTCFYSWNVITFCTLVAFTVVEINNISCWID